MAYFLRSTPIKSTRKTHRCFACGEIINKGDNAVAWVSVDGGTVFSVHLHPECWEVTKTNCFSCKNCDGGDGFHEGYLYESMNNGSECDGVKSLPESRRIAMAE
jgi:hypothetical protein